MADIPQNPFDKEALDRLEDAVDLSRALVDNANELNRIYKKAGSAIQDPFAKATRSLAKSLNDMSTQMGKMSIDEFKRSEAVKLQKKLAEDITKLRTEQERIETKTLPNRQQQANLAEKLKKDKEDEYRNARLQFGATSTEASLAKDRLDLAIRVNDRAKEKLKVEQDAVVTAKELVKAAEEQNDQLETYIDRWDQANLRVGAFGKVLKGLKKIPILGDLLNADKALKAMQKSALAGESAFKTMGKGIKGAFEGIEKSTLILAGLSALVKVFKFFIDLMMAADKQVTSLAQNLSISKKEAGDLRTNLAGVVKTLDVQYKVTSAIIDAQLQLNQLTALSAYQTDALLENQIKLTKELGLSEEEAANLNSIFKTNTEEGEKSIDLVYRQIAAYANQNKILFNGRKILKEVSQVSGQILASFKGSTVALTNAVMRVNKLGLTLEKAKTISESLLDFESSIQSQMEAEVLTGKQLVLDRARLLALQGDYAGVAEEVTRTVGNYTQFSKLNVIQQQAIAKSIGMSADDLADSLRKQQLITGQAKEQIKLLRERGLITRADALEQGILSGKSLEDAERSLSIQDKFNLALEKAKDIFGDMVTGGLLDDLVDVLNSIVDSIKGTSRYKESIEKAAASSGKEVSAVDKLMVEDLQKTIEDQPGMIRKGIFTGLSNILTLGGSSNLFGIQDEYKRKEQEAQAARKQLREIQGRYENKGDDTTINGKDFTIKTLPEDTIKVAGGTKLGRTDEMVKHQEKQNKLLEAQNQLLAIIASKDYTLDGQRLTNGVANTVPTLYGNLLNIGSSNPYS